MLINTTHKYHSGRVPPDLLEVYVRYKQGTKAIIAWLVEESRRRILKTVSIRDLVQLTKTVQARAVSMPEMIDFHFRETIAARRKLSSFFRKAEIPDAVDANTVNHEYFTECLTKIYGDLCECCSEPKKLCAKIAQDQQAQCSNNVEPNRFASLSGVSEDCGPILDNTTSEFTQGRDPQERAGNTQEGRRSESPGQLRLIDDDLGDAFEACAEIEKMASLVLSTNKVWEKAAQGGTPLVVAAFVTNAALVAFEEIEQRLQALSHSSTPEALKLKIQHLGNKMSEQYDADESPSALDEIGCLELPWHSLVQCKCDHTTHKSDAPLCSFQQQSEIIIRRASDSTAADQKCLCMILENIAWHVRAIRRPASIVRLGTPLYADVGYFLTHEEENVNGLRCCFGLQVLLESYKSYLLASPVPSMTSSCRLQALKFAQEAAPNIQAVLHDSTMPCRCYQTLAFHLQNMHEDLEHFLRERVFDLYFQSPWVSGSHMLEMLETTFYYGLRLFSYRHYVGSVLHVYNVLRLHTGLGSIPVLEQLCNTFDDIIFPGGRPSRSFKASCVRYRGGRLKFKKQSSDHRSGNHHMVIPAHTAKATAGFGLHKEANDSRFEYKKISLFHHIKEKGYILDDTTWNRVCEQVSVDGHDTLEPKPKQACYSRRRRTHSDLSAMPTSDRFVHLEKAVLADFTGPFPIAKINLFKAYLACVRIISTISDKMHAENDSGLNCLCFVDVLLSHADRFRDNQHKLQPFGCKELVNTCSDAIKEVLGGKTLDEFLWKNI